MNIRRTGLGMSNEIIKLSFTAQQVLNTTSKYCYSFKTPNEGIDLGLVESINPVDPTELCPGEKISFVTSALYGHWMEAVDHILQQCRFQGYTEIERQNYQNEMMLRVYANDKNVPAVEHRIIVTLKKTQKEGDVFPEPIRKLPEADIPLEGVKGYLSQAENHQIVFMQFEKDTDIPEHSHAAQIGIVLEGKIDLVIDGKKQTYTKGDRYYILKGIKHSAKIYAGYADITFFNEKDRYKKK